MAAKRETTEAKYQAERDARETERLARRQASAQAAHAAKAAKRVGAPPAPPPRHPQAIRRDRERMDRYRVANYPWFKERVEVAEPGGASTKSPASVLAAWADPRGATRL